MILEVLLAVLSNVKIFFGLGAVILAFATLGWLGYGNEIKNEEMKKKWIRLKWVPKSFIFFVFMALIPTVDDIWRVRIALIKLELAKKENIEAGVDTIERIGRKLECKYLGCRDSK